MYLSFKLMCGGVLTRKFTTFLEVKELSCRLLQSVNTFTTSRKFTYSRHVMHSLPSVCSFQVKELDIIRWRCLLARWKGCRGVRDVWLITARAEIDVFFTSLYQYNRYKTLFKISTLCQWNKVLQNCFAFLCAKADDRPLTVLWIS